MKTILILYYCLTLGANTAAAILFSENISLSPASAVPLFFMLLSVFQAIYFHKNRKKKDFNINNSSDLTESEWELMTVYMRNTYLIVIPAFLPFTLFFNTWIKLVSIFIFLIGFSGGAVYFKVKHRKELRARFEKEKADLLDQAKKEEEGRWK